MTNIYKNLTKQQEPQNITTQFCGIGSQCNKFFHRLKTENDFFGIFFLKQKMKIFISKCVLIGKCKKQVVHSLFI